MISVSHASHGAWNLVVNGDGKQLHQSRIGGENLDATWQTITVDLGPLAGKQVDLELRNASHDSGLEAGYWERVEEVFRLAFAANPDFTIVGSNLHGGIPASDGGETRQSQEESSPAGRQRRSAAVGKSEMLAGAAGDGRRWPRPSAEAGYEVVRAHAYKQAERHGFIASQKEGMARFRRIDPEAS